jgi:hypothetical protein
MKSYNLIFFHFPSPAGFMVKGCFMAEKAIATLDYKQGKYSFGPDSKDKIEMIFCSCEKGNY